MIGSLGMDSLSLWPQSVSLSSVNLITFLGNLTTDYTSFKSSSVLFLSIGIVCCKNTTDVCSILDSDLIKININILVGIIY